MMIMIYLVQYFTKLTQRLVLCSAAQQSDYEIEDLVQQTLLYCTRHYESMVNWLPYHHRCTPQHPHPVPLHMQHGQQHAPHHLEHTTVRQYKTQDNWRYQVPQTIK